MKEERALNLPVQGLRAVAVLAVVGYHAHLLAPEIRQILPGGFLGVDMFFVISGFVIAQSLQRLSESGVGGFKSFLGRRFRRLFPALFFTVLIVLLASSYFEGWSSELYAYGLAAILGLANFAFWLTDDYDSPALETHPLLHTWSLGVEEQFYLVLAIVFLLARALRKINLLTLVVIASTASFTIAAVFWMFDSAASFYLLPARFWEFGVGVILALALPNLSFRKSLSIRASSIIQLIALAVILASLLVLPLSPFHPGPVTVPLVLSVAALILFAESGGPVNKLLSSRPVVKIGAASYSIYLLHWPISVSLAGQEMPMATSLAALVYFSLSIVFGLISRWAIEEPFINRTWRSARPATFLRLGATASAIALVATANSLSPTQLSPENLASLPEPTANPPQSTEHPGRWWSSYERANPQAVCPGYAEDQALTEFCIIGNRTEKPSFMLVGDSHARGFVEFVDQQLAAESRTGLFGYAPGCPFLPGTYPQRKSSAQTLNCKSASDLLKRELLEPNITSLWLVGRWDYYIGTGQNWLSDNLGGPYNLEHSRNVAIDSLAELINLAHSRGLSILVFDQMPHQQVSPRDLINGLGEGLAEPTNLEGWISSNSLPLERHLEREAFEESFFDEVSRRVSRPLGEWYVPNHDFFCRESTCLIADSGGLFYFDDDHLSKYGVERFMFSGYGSRALASLK